MEPTKKKTALALYKYTVMISLSSVWKLLSSKATFHVNYLHFLPHFKLEALASLFNCIIFYQKIRQCFLRVAHALNSAVTATCAALGNWFLTNLYLKHKGK